MLKKIAVWFFKIAGALLLLLAISGILLVRYVQNHQEAAIQELAHSFGLGLEYRSLTLEGWNSFPKIRLTADSLVLRDTLTAPHGRPLVQLDTLIAAFEIGEILSGKIRMDTVIMSGGAFYSTRNKDGDFNYGNLFKSDPGQEQDEDSPVSLSWKGAHLRLSRIQCYHQDSLKRKEIAFELKSFVLDGRELANDTYELNTRLSAWVNGVAFNTDKGAFLRNSSVSGPFQVLVHEDSVVVYPTDLRIAEQIFNFRATVDKKTSEALISIKADSVDYDQARTLLHRELRKKLKEYHVEGPFPVKADIYIDPTKPRNPEINISFSLAGQSVNLQQYSFTKVHTSGQIVNRLSPVEGGIPGSKKNLRIELGPVRGLMDGINIEAPSALIAAIEKDAILTAPVFLSGPAAALSRQLKNTQFFFRNGRFTLKTSVSASLNDVNQLIDNSDGILTLEQVDVFYEPARVVLPFESIRLNKQRDDITFMVRTQPLPTGLALDFEGTIDNLAPLLLDLPGGALNSEVNMHASRIDWTDFRAIFGEEGYLADFETTDQEAAQAASMRKTLIGLKESFHPEINATFDTVAYYDIFQLTDFSSGLHFASDTLILERTKFSWAGSQIDFGARLLLSQVDGSPFSIRAKAHELDLNRLLSPLSHFGLKLPAEIDKLPQSLGIDFWHRGQLNDAAGIMPGYNTGQLNFYDTHQQLFSGLMKYSPGTSGLETQLSLEGSPVFINHLFAAENFFFGEGKFLLDLELTGTPQTVSDLIQQSVLNLYVENSEVAYEPQNIKLPIKHFRANINRGETDFELNFTTGKIKTPIWLRGNLDDFDSFFSPVQDQQYHLRSSLTAEKIYWSDLRAIIADLPDSEPSAGLLDVLASQSSILRRYQPEILIEVDSLYLDEKTALLDLQFALRAEEKYGLLLDSSTFTLGDGHFYIQAALGTELPNTPLEIEARLTDLSAEQLWPGLRSVGLNLSPDLQLLSGNLDLDLNFTGQLLQDQRGVDWPNSYAVASLNVQDLYLPTADFLEKTGRKLLMRKRFRNVLSSPISANLTLDSGLITIPRMELQNTAVQLFVEGDFDMEKGPDLLISFPLRNIGRGVKETSPPKSGYVAAGWKVYLVLKKDEKGRSRTRFRLGRRKFFKERGELEQFRQQKEKQRQDRKNND